MYKIENVIFEGETYELETGISLLVKRLPNIFRQNSKELIISVSKTEKFDLKLTGRGNKYLIEYREKIHFFRAIGLLNGELLGNTQECNICENACFKNNDVMIDCSRNAVLKESEIKRLLEYMALMGLNVLMLYTEDTYEVEGKPYFGYMRGRYTKKELRECDIYAEYFGIEMFPCIQTLGHLSTMLRWDCTEQIRDTGDILLVDEKETYDFLEEIITEAVAPFRSRRIHIGMDEAHNVGLGNYLNKHGYCNRFDILNKHLTKVMEICRNKGLKAIMWSDMYFRVASTTGDYYDANAYIPEDIIKAVPVEISLVYWDYYHDQVKDYEKMLMKHQSFNRTIIFAGATFQNFGAVPDYQKTFTVMMPAMRACEKYKVQEVINTVWADNGAEANIFCCLPGLLLEAEYCYEKRTDKEYLKKRFLSCTGSLLSDFFTLEKLEKRQNYEELMLSSNSARYMLWQDVLLGLLDKHIPRGDCESYYKHLATKLNSMINGELWHVFEVPSILAEVLSIKSEIGIHLKKAYDTEDREALGKIVNERLSKLEKLVIKLREAHRRQWLSIYKPFGWEVLDMRYGGLIARIETASFRIKSYLRGEIDKLPELEQERLTFDCKKEDKRLIRCPRYHRIVSANSMGFNE